ncbi:hypothetical protein TNCV_4887061 [Trichonephila clavipes]|nr:hypothetical protein TNCV_4887061 [Trichonephila clavipes]
MYRPNYETQKKVWKKSKKLILTPSPQIGRKIHPSEVSAPPKRPPKFSTLLLVDVITRPVRPERQREDTTNKRRKQSDRIKPIQDLAHTIYEAVYKKKTESMRTSTTSKSTAYLAAYSTEEASVWKR